MRLQLLSDLHLETESFDPRPAPGAEALVLAGDIDTTWAAFERFRGWSVPVLMVAGNHEFDGRELRSAWVDLRARCEDCGITLLEQQSLVLAGDDGRRIRFVGTIRWSDFDLFGEPERERAMRAARYFMAIMNATRDGQPFDAEGVRQESLACRRWLEAELMRRGDWQATVVLTHFGPSLKSADPRYGAAPGTASFCNADDDLLARCDAWLHGHLHCRQDYTVPRPGRAPTRVISQARGLAMKGEDQGFDPLAVFTL
jgi:DNA repair exonuclease SbcCD nuclease subunit